MFFPSHPNLPSFLVNYENQEGVVQRTMAIAADEPHLGSQSTGKTQVQLQVGKESAKVG